MDILWSIKQLGEGSISPRCTSILRSCSHSLETSVWHQTTRGKCTFGYDPANVPRFEKLRKIGLGFVKLGDSGIVNALLEPSLGFGLEVLS
jgi:hypothetical protein